jgi:hypothetical protein
MCLPLLRGQDVPNRQLHSKPVGKIGQSDHMYTTNKGVQSDVWLYIVFFEVIHLECCSIPVMYVCWPGKGNDCCQYDQV